MTEPSTVQASGEAPPEPGRRDEPVPPLYGELRPALASLTALLLSVGLLSLGNGLQGTLIGVRAGMEGFGAALTGGFMAGYSGGFVLGSLLSPRLIHRIGHIRSFAALASIISAVTLLHPLIISAPSWTAIRAVAGFCYAGLIMVAESWLNGRATVRTRGGLLAVYGIVGTGAWGMGQFLLSVADPGGFELFCLVSIVMSVALVPVTLTRSQQPGLVTPSRIGLGGLFRASPIGIVGCLTTGLCVGALLGLGPVYAQQLGMDAAGIGRFMGLALFGALALHGPIGWLSDALDRRHVILGTVSAALFVSGLLAVAGNFWMPLTLAAAFLFGGLVMPTYSLCVAHLNDNIGDADLVPAAGGVLVVYGVGAVLGPLVAGLLMEVTGTFGLFAWTGVVLAIFLAFAWYRITWHRTVPIELQGPFVAVPHASTHVATALDPRGGKGG